MLAVASSLPAIASMVPLVIFLAVALCASACSLMVPSVPLVPDTLVLSALLLLLAPAVGGLVPLVLACGLLALLVAAWCCTTLLPPFLHLVGVLITTLLSFFLHLVGVLAMVNVLSAADVVVLLLSLCACVWCFVVVVGC